MDISNIKLHLIRDRENNNNEQSCLLVSHLQNNDSLKKIRWTCKHYETDTRQVPFISYTTKEQKKIYISNIDEIDEVLNQFNAVSCPKTTIVYEEMMETPIY